MALLAAMPADARFGTILPGWNTANINCITLPIAPTGVVSVSPVARQATSERTKAIAMAIKPAHQEISNATICTNIMAIPMGTMPITIHEKGTSTSFIATDSDASARAPLSDANARVMVFHCIATAVRLAMTMTAVPPQSDQVLMRNVVPAPFNSTFLITVARAWALSNATW